VLAFAHGLPAEQEPIAVPHSELSADALRGVIEAFVLREGTEYGERDVSIDRKVADVLRQLERGEVQIVFDPNTETVDIVVRRRSWLRPVSPSPT